MGAAVSEPPDTSGPDSVAHTSTGPSSSSTLAVAGMETVTAVKINFG